MITKEQKLELFQKALDAQIIFENSPELEISAYLEGLEDAFKTLNIYSEWEAIFNKLHSFYITNRTENESYLEVFERLNKTPESFIMEYFHE